METMYWKKLMAVAVAAGMLAVVNVQADSIEVGSGDNLAGIYIEWSDGFVAEFDVSFATETLTGLGAFDIIEANTTLTTVRDDFGWGIFVDGISFDGHSNSGYGGGEDWWHYWVDNGTGWTSPSYGVADRVLYNGYADGWIYGRAGAVPEPTMLALLGIGTLLMGKRKRR